MPAVIGPTGRFPSGPIRPDDAGETFVTISHEEGHVIMDFGCARTWVGLTPQQAIDIGIRIQQEAHEAQYGRTQ